MKIIRYSLIIALILVLLLGLYTAVSQIKPHREVLQSKEYSTPTDNNLMLYGHRFLIEERPAIVTMYNPVPEQTDNTPFINASGNRVQEGDIANNCLEFGTIVYIDGKEYVVRDRLHQRYNCSYYDILTFDKEKAIEWGKQYKTIEVVN